MWFARPPSTSRNDYCRLERSSLARLVRDGVVLCETHVDRDVAGSRRVFGSIKMTSRNTNTIKT